MDATTARRLQVTSLHLRPDADRFLSATECGDRLHSFDFEGEGEASLQSESVSSSSSSSSSFATSLRAKQVDVDTLKTFMDGPCASTKDAMREWLSNTTTCMELSQDLTLDECRQRVHEWVEEFVSVSPIKLTDLRDDPAKFVAAVEMTTLFNVNLTTKLAVQYSLWGGTVMNLGTERHHGLLPAIESVELPGCFAMTELGHGSNVNGVETTAEYDPKTQEFVLNSPTFTSSKFWIGNAANYALKATVFARLIIDGEDKGVHAFVADMRDPRTKKVLPGITVFDCGEKMGLQGVDNGGIQFSNVRIPRENMLNRFSDVTPDNKYVSRLDSPGKHFGATVGELSGGRVVIGSGALIVSKMALAIAIRFGWARKQFGPAPGAEIPIMTYPTHKLRLMPALATTVVLDSLARETASRFATRTEADAGFVHSLSAALKAFGGWHMSATIQTCRESCGGQGYRSKNRLGSLKADTDIFLTYEGDNIVLAQQVTRYLMAVLSKRDFGANSILSFLKSPTTCQVLQSGSLGGKSVQEAWSCTKLQLSLFEKAEGGLLQKLGAKLAAAAKAGVPQYDAWQSNLNLINRVAEAHYNRLSFLAFQRELAEAPASIRSVLELCGQLDALSRISKALGWHLSNGSGIPVEMAQELEDVRESLCDELASYSQGIVRAFGIPEKCLPREDLLEVSLKK